MDAVRIIVFSKDRSFQLSELLHSIQQYLVLPSQPHVHIDVKILYKVSCEPFKSSYKLLKEQFAQECPCFEFVEETDFSSQLLALVDSTPLLLSQTAKTQNDDAGDNDDLQHKRSPQLNPTGTGTNSCFVLFTVDDALFVRDFDLGTAIKVLKGNDTVFTYHLKLHSAITFSHTANTTSCVPTLESCGKVSNSLKQQLIESVHFDRSEGTLDWNYPWDLAGYVTCK